MKKTYYSPKTVVVKLTSVKPILTASIQSLNGEAESSAVGMGRESSGDFYDEAE